MTMSEAQLQYLVQWVPVYVIVLTAVGVFAGLCLHRVAVDVWMKLTFSRRYKAFAIRYEARLAAQEARLRRKV